MLKVITPTTEAAEIDNNTLAGTLRLCHLSEFKHDMGKVCDKVTEAMNKEIEAGTLKDGDLLVLPMEDGSKLRFSVNEKTVEIKHRKDYKTNEIYVKGIAPEEYAEKFAAFSEAYSGKVGVGEPCPESVKDMLKNLQPGDIVSFGGVHDTYARGNQKSPVMVCLANDEKGIDLVECMDTVKYNGDLSYDEFAAGRLLDERVHLDYDNPENMQYFYLSIKDPMTDAAVLNSTRIESVFRKEYEKVCEQLGKGKDGIIELTISERNKLTVEKKGNELTWYGKDGHVLSNNNVGLYLAWTRSQPVIVRPQIPGNPEVIQDPLGVFDRASDMRDYENALSKGYYEQAADRLADYCKHYCTDVALSIASDDGIQKYKFMYDLNKSNNVQTCIIMKEELNEQGQPNYTPLTQAMFGAEVGAIIEASDSVAGPTLANQSQQPVNGYTSEQFVAGCNVVFKARESMLNARTEAERYFESKFNEQGKVYDQRDSR